MDTVRQRVERSYQAMSHSFKTPGFVVILIDQSGSMNARWGGSTRKEEAAAMVNKCIEELCSASRDGNEYVNRTYMAVLGYSDLPGEPLLRELTYGWTRDVALHPRTGRWVAPMADGKTPMAKVFHVLREWIHSFFSIESHARIFEYSLPPLVIHITDAMANEFELNAAKLAWAWVAHHGPGGATEKACSRLRSLPTPCGAPLLFNACISDLNQEVLFPSSDENFDKYSRLLFQISDELPEIFRSQAARLYTDGRSIFKGAKGLVLNASPDAIFKLLQVGTFNKV